jgi:NAD(P) transhydrogenase
MHAYDLIIVGAGPAGIVAAATAATLGRTVAVVDRAELGGAGVNTGTVPSKTLRETALALSGLRSRNLYGVDLSLRREATVSDFLHHERNVKKGLHSMLADRLAASQTAAYHGAGRFADPHTIAVEPPDGAGPVHLRGECILMATGPATATPLAPRGVFMRPTFCQLFCAGSYSHVLPSMNGEPTRIAPN